MKINILCMMTGMLWVWIKSIYCLPVLRSLIEKRDLKEGQRLPTMVQLSKDAGAVY
jgi:hypothetical protein